MSDDDHSWLEDLLEDLFDFIENPRSLWVAVLIAVLMIAYAIWR
jgi:hypothetical protein